MTTIRLDLFVGVNARTACLRIILLVAAFAGMVASMPVWLTSRGYPLLPVATWFPALPSPWDQWFFGVVLLSLMLAGWVYRPAVVFFLCATLFLYLGDQNRAQPWFYLYWVMLLLTLLREPTALAGCRWAVSAVYVWSGLQKCNADFFAIVPEWFVRPATGWHLGDGTIRLLQWLIAAAPLMEIFIGLALWLAPVRRVAIGAAIALHLTALLFLGPLGHRYNAVIWPWNLAMVALVVALLPAAPAARVSVALAELRRSKPALVVVLLFWLLPVLSYFGRWDSYFSFSLYSANLATANIYVSPAFRDQLPARMKRFVHRLKPPLNPVLQKPLVFDHEEWALAELGVPPLPEPRSFQVLFHHLQAYGTNPNDLHMIVRPRRGPMRFYQGGNSWRLELQQVNRNYVSVSTRQEKTTGAHYPASGDLDPMRNSKQTKTPSP